MAATDIDPTTAAEAVQSSTQGFSTSTDLATGTDVTEAKPTANSLAVAASEGTLASANVLPEIKASLSEPAASSPTVAATQESATAANLTPLTETSQLQPAASLPKFSTSTSTSTKSPILSASRRSLDASSAASAETKEVRTLVDAATVSNPNTLQAQALPSEESSEQVLPAGDPLEMGNPEDMEANPLDQVTNVSQLSDVEPSDWAYEALRSLVERYGCIAGYPDGTFRGNRALSRYEFAAGVNACLQQIEKLIAASSADAATEADLETLRRLVDEFGPELATLRTRVDNLEGRTAFLESHQFSTTTKLFGQAVVGVQGRNENEFELFLNRKSTGNRLEDPNTNPNVISNVQLSLFTQFSPRSLLLTGLQAGSGNTGPRLLNNDMVFLGYEGDTGNDIVLSDLTYRQLIGNNFAFIIGPEGVNPVNVFRGANRVESAGQGPLSRFAQRNPIINTGGRGGLGFDWQVNPRISLQGVYSASRPADAFRGGIGGGQDGETAAGLQLVVSPLDTLDIGLQYVNSYSPFGRLGTGVGDDLVLLPTPAGRGPINTNAFGASLEFRATPNITIGGWGGYTTSDAQGISGNVETFNWMAYLNFPDLLGEGNLGGIYVGQPPKITSSDLPIGRNYPNFISEGGFGEEGGQPGSTTHVEAFYRFRVSDNITVTPGVMVLFNPLHNQDNDTITIGAIRTTFTF
ncbi:carbohydrate porin [Coleofasciculus sp. FACHB-1120]|nr:iron uptake porin [Coleofasciculus sp. FACHB-1120]MBD2742912.1 carbohydrate porin [Coleofasciculus sp. FACHB-1120]